MTSCYVWSLPLAVTPAHVGPLQPPNSFSHVFSVKVTSLAFQLLPPTISHHIIPHSAILKASLLASSTRLGHTTLSITVTSSTMGRVKRENKKITGGVIAERSRQDKPETSGVGRPLGNREKARMKKREQSGTNVTKPEWDDQQLQGLIERTQPHWDKAVQQGHMPDNVKPGNLSQELRDQMNDPHIRTTMQRDMSLALIRVIFYHATDPHNNFDITYRRSVNNFHSLTFLINTENTDGLSRVDLLWYRAMLEARDHPTIFEARERYIAAWKVDSNPTAVDSHIKRIFDCQRALAEIRKHIKMKKVEAEMGKGKGKAVAAPDEDVEMGEEEGEGAAGDAADDDGDDAGEEDPWGGEPLLKVFDGDEDDVIEEEEDYAAAGEDFVDKITYAMNNASFEAAEDFHSRAVRRITAEDFDDFLSSI